MSRIPLYLTKISIYALVFLMPLLVIPFTFERYEFNKQTTLFFLVSLGLIGWLWKMIGIKKKLVWRRTPLDIPILIFLVALICSTVFSVDKYVSLFGFYGRFTDNLIGAVALIVMYFLIVNNFKKTRRELKSFFVLLVSSVFLVIVSAYLSIFGIWSKISFFARPQFSFIRLKTFNLAGASSEGLSILLASVLSGITALILGILIKFKLWKEERKLTERLWLSFCCLTLFAGLGLLILIDFWAAWVVLGLSMLILLLFAFWTHFYSKRVNVLLLPIFLILISISGLFVDLRAQIRNSFFSNFDLPKELILDYHTDLSLTLQALKNKDYLPFGSGIGTFVYDFSLFKPKEFNQSRFWNIRFDKAPAHFLEMILTIGLLGLGAYLFLILVSLIIFRLALKKRNSWRESHLKYSYEAWPVWLCWFALLIGQFVYLQNSVLSFLFWLFLALAIVSWRKLIDLPIKKLSFSFKKWPEMSLVMNTILIVIVLLLFGLFYFAGRFWWADVLYVKGIQAKEIGQGIEWLEKAVSLNPYRNVYQMDLSQSYLLRAKNEAIKPSQNQNIQLVAGDISRAIAQAKRASELSPNWVRVWENLGLIYRDLVPIVKGADQWAINSFKKALELEPVNPVLKAEIGKIHLARVNNLDKKKEKDKIEKEINQALNYFQEAVDLKSDYLDPKVQIALAEEKKGNLEEAIKKLEDILLNQRFVGSPVQVEAMFQLGRLYFNAKLYDKAIVAFIQVIRLIPYHSNAHYGLGLSYLKKNLKEKALEEFQIVSKLNPDNQEIKERIKKLEKEIKKTQKKEEK